MIDVNRLNLTIVDRLVCLYRRQVLLQVALYRVFEQRTGEDGRGCGSICMMSSGFTFWVKITRFISLRG